MNDTIQAFMKSTIGLLGTTLSFSLSNASELMAIVAAGATAWYMIQQALYSREKKRLLQESNRKDEVQ